MTRIQLTTRKRDKVMSSFWNSFVLGSVVIEVGDQIKDKSLTSLVLLFFFFLLSLFFTLAKTIIVAVTSLFLYLVSYSSLEEDLLSRLTGCLLYFANRKSKSEIWSSEKLLSERSEEKSFLCWNIERLRFLFLGSFSQSLIKSLWDKFVQKRRVVLESLAWKISLNSFFISLLTRNGLMNLSSPSLVTRYLTCFIHSLRNDHISPIIKSRTTKVK